MILCLDIGNSQIYGGVFKGETLLFQFRRTSRNNTSSDELGVFLRSVLRENDLDPDQISDISICTVVPEILHSLKNACRKYFGGIQPFLLQAGVKTGLNIKYRNPLELGADRIANAIAATHLHPNQNVIIIDMGTATTFCAVSSKKEFLGGAIIPGLKIAMQALEDNTSKLPSVEIVEVTEATAKTTIEGIQAGLYFGTIGAIKEITSRMKTECFRGEPTLIIGTGGFASLFTTSKVFDQESYDLVLKGLYLALKINKNLKGAKNATQHAEM
jgi:type III pantothenate kinase